MKQSKKLRKTILLVLFSFTLTACLNNVEEETILEDIEEGDTDPCETITFSNNVKSIIDTSCIQCHGNGGNLPNLSTFDRVQNNSAIVKSVIASRRMPLGGSLSQEEIDAVVCWVDGGALNN